MELNKMILVERLQQAGASESEIVRAVEDDDGGERRERREPFWRRVGNAIFAS